MRQVFIVQPDDDLRALLIELLTDAGYSARVMPSMRAALLALETLETPSVVLVDHSISSAADSEYLTYITALRRHICLLMSTNPEQLPALLGSQRPVIIAEPFDIEELVDAVGLAAKRCERL